MFAEGKNTPERKTQVGLLNATFQNQALPPGRWFLCSLGPKHMETLGSVIYEFWNVAFLHKTGLFLVPWWDLGNAEHLSQTSPITHCIKCGRGAVSFHVLWSGSMVSHPTSSELPGEGWGFSGSTEDLLNQNLGVVWGIFKPLPCDSHITDTQTSIWEPLP